MCALDEVQVTFACIGHPSGTTVTILIQVSFNGLKNGHKELLSGSKDRSLDRPQLLLLCLCAAVRWAGALMLTSAETNDNMENSFS